MSLISPQFPPGFVHYPQFFNQEEQRQLISQVKQAVATAPFYKPTMPGTGHPLSVVMSNFGPLGWVTDKENGYRYEKDSSKNWPAMASFTPSIRGALVKGFWLYHTLLKQH